MLDSVRHVLRGEPFKTVRLLQLPRYLCQQMVWTDANGTAKFRAYLFPNSCLDLAGKIQRRLKLRGLSTKRHLEFIDGADILQLRYLINDTGDFLINPHIQPMPGGAEDNTGAKLLCGIDTGAGFDAICLGFITCRNASP